MKTEKEILELLSDIFKNVQLENNHYIDIYNKNGFFSAKLFLGKVVITTGVSGFISMWKKFGIPVLYNGQLLPIAQYDEFLEYCLKLENYDQT